MVRQSQDRLSEWPRWFRVLCYGPLAAIVLGMAYRTLVDAPSMREAIRGLAGIVILCLWLSYAVLSKTRWRDRNFRTGLALLACLAITATVLFLVRPPHERWPDRDLVITFGVGLLFALALVGSRYVSLSSRSFGVLVSAADVGIAGLGLSGYGSGALG